jgi:hypothetical protein
MRALFTMAPATGRFHATVPLAATLRELQAEMKALPNPGEAVDRLETLARSREPQPAEATMPA